MKYKTLKYLAYNMRHLSEREFTLYMKLDAHIRRKLLPETVGMSMMDNQSFEALGLMLAKCH